MLNFNAKYATVNFYFFFKFTVKLIFYIFITLEYVFIKRHDST